MTLDQLLAPEAVVKARLLQHLSQQLPLYSGEPIQKGKSHGRAS
jgi:hypothetical protein